MQETIFIDQTYIGMIANLLKNFRSKGNGVYEFSHSCESPTSKKRRGYFFKKGGGYRFMCHNCQESKRFSDFLEFVNPALHKEYRFEVYKANNAGPLVKAEPVWEEKKPEKPKATYEGLACFSGLDPSHPAVRLIDKRQIPKDQYDKLYFCRHFATWARQYSEAFERSQEDTPRLVIPYKNMDGELIGFTCRAFGNEQPKYIEIKVDPDADMIFGLDKIDFSKPIITVEGPIDSMFLPNAIATGGAAYRGAFFDKYKPDMIIVPDNDWKRNPDILREVTRLAHDGYRVALIPDIVVGKDINKIIQNGKYTASDLTEMIYSSEKSGAALLLEIALRRKC